MSTSVVKIYFTSGYILIVFGKGYRFSFICTFNHTRIVSLGIADMVAIVLAIVKSFKHVNLNKTHTSKHSLIFSAYLVRNNS